LGREDPQILWCRTALGRYAYQMEMIGDEEESNLSADNWLNSISDETNPFFQSTQSARQKSTLVDEIFDPFQV